MNSVLHSHLGEVAESQRRPCVTLIFADDIVLMSNTIQQAQQLLINVEKECKGVGLALNSAKTKAMYINSEVVEPLWNNEGDEIEQALTEAGNHDFKYLVSWCDKNRDISTRKALAWRSINKLDKIWKSNIDEKLKIMLFRATTETILLYGCQTWSLTVAEEKSLNGTYTRMLRKVKNIYGRRELAIMCSMENANRSQ